MPVRPITAEPLSRLIRSADFERVLHVRSRAKTTHFAVHHLHALPTGPLAPPHDPGPAKLSTGELTSGGRPVDDSSHTASTALLARAIGVVVPKRHARRSVTRSLLKRQIYAAAERHRPRLAAGLWVVRLRAPFEKAHFPSAASEALRSTARLELDDLFGSVTAARP